MKFGCACGNVVHDAGDPVPGKVHFIPDEKLWPLLEKFDSVLASECGTERQREMAGTKLRSLLIQTTRQGWICSSCGRLYLDEKSGPLKAFVPEDGAP